MIKVILSDGTELTNLSKNGEVFISAEAIDESLFDMNCSNVVIIEDDHSETHEHMALIGIQEEVNNGVTEYWFGLRDLTSEELYKIKTQSDIEYLAMMTGVEL